MTDQHLENSAELKVNITRIIKAPINSVFDAWLDPEKLSLFMLPMSEMRTSIVTNDPREQGEFSIIMRLGDEEMPHTGRYLKIERPYNLSFTWASQASLDDSVVTLVFIKLTDNQTEINLTHTKFINEERRSNHERGWSRILEALSELY